MSFEPESDVPVVDQKALNEAFDGDVEFAEKLISLYVTSVSETLQKLDEAVANRNREPAVRHAHTLKGASLNLGALRVASVSAKVEAQLKQGCFDEKSIWLPKLKTEFARASSGLSEYLKTLSKR